MRRFLPKIIYRDQFAQIVFTLKQIIKIVWRVDPRSIVIIFLISSFWGLLTFPTFYLEKLILDRLVANIGNTAWQQAVYPISFLIVARMLIEIIRNVLGSILYFMRRFAAQNFHIEIELILARKLSELDVLTIEDPVFQDKYNKIEREAGRRAWGLMMPFTDMPNFIFGFISSIGVLWFLHPLVALGAALAVLPTIFVDRKYIRKMYDFDFLIAPRHRIRGHLSHYLIRSKNYMEVRILGLRDYLISRLAKVHREIVDQEKQIEKETESAKVYTYFPSLLFSAGTNIYLAFLVITQKITIGSYELFLRSLLSASSNFSSLTNSFLEIYENYIYVTDLVWYLGLEPRINITGGKKTKGIKEGISLENIWFRYKEDGKWILKGTTASLRAGEKVAIVGENGAGKSTLIKVLARFYDPNKGMVLLDGEDIRSLNYKSYQNKFAILFQDFEDFSFTARESIGFGDIARVDKLEEIKEAARKTGIHQHLESLPLGYDTPLSPHFEKGVNLSGGQWQRVGIARVLFRKNSEIMILDEPTSNVDPEAEEKIFNELYKISKDKILIFVSQRFSTVRRADRILVMDKGTIVESGTHEELMKEKGKYARLFLLQAKGYR